MKKLLFIFIFILLGSVAAYIYRKPLINEALELCLEAKLEDLFGLRVTIDDLKFDYKTGDLETGFIEFFNPKGYSERPHLQGKRLELNVNLQALKERRVEISHIDLYDGYYLIETRKTDGTGFNNVLAWFRHMRPLNRKKKPPKPENKRWLTKIDEISLHNVIFELRLLGNPENEKNFYFTELEGTLYGFRKPNDISVMSQRVELKGLMGRIKPAPFEITGVSNWATSKISFDLKGKTERGDMRDYEFLLQDMPVELVSGEIELETHAKCFQKDLRADSLLKIYDLEVKPKKGVREFISGTPMLATLGFIQSQKMIELKMPVEGNISDPKFGLSEAFRLAFREAFGKHVSNGVQAIRDGAKVVGEGIGKLSNFVKETVPIATKKDEGEGAF